MLPVLLLLVLLVTHSSDACSCFQQPLQNVLCTAETLVKVQVTEEIDKGIDFDDLENQGYSREYRATVLQVFSGDVSETEIVIQTPGHAGLCGTILTPDTWLLELDVYLGSYQASLCQLHRRWDYDLDDELTADLVQGTLDCDCQPTSRYGATQCCNDFQDMWSVRQCSAYFGNCRKQQSMGSSCGWEKDYDYENCLNGYGYHLNDDACVARKPCPESAEYKFGMFEQVTCEDSVARRLSWGKDVCRCPEDKPFLDTTNNRCVTDMHCPRGEPMEDPDDGSEMDVVEMRKSIKCPSNQVYYGEGKCLPCLQNCGSSLAWCTRICITDECGCPADKPVLALDTCYTQKECKDISGDVNVTSSTLKSSTSQYEFQSSPPTEVSSSEYDFKSSPPTVDSTEISSTSAYEKATTSDVKTKSSSPADQSSTPDCIGLACLATESGGSSSPSIKETTSQFVIQTSASTEGTASDTSDKSSPPTETSSPDCKGMACLLTEETATSQKSTTQFVSSPPTEGSTSEIEIKTSPPTKGSTSEMEVETSPQTEGSTSEMEIQTSPPIEGSTSEMEMQTSPPTEGSTSELEIKTSPPSEGSTSEMKIKTSPPTEEFISELEIKTSPPSEGSTSEMDIKTSPPSEGSTSEMKIKTSAPSEGSTSEMEIITSPPSEGSTSEMDIKTSPPSEGSTSEIEVKTSAPSEGSTSEMEIITSPPSEGSTSEMEIKTSPPSEGSTSEIEVKTSPPTDGSTSEIEIKTSPPSEGSTSEIEVKTSPPTDGSTSEMEVETSPPTEGTEGSSITPDCIGLSCLTTESGGSSSPSIKETTSQFVIQTSASTEGTASDTSDKSSPPTETSSPDCEGMACLLTEETATSQKSTTQFVSSPPTEGSTSEIEIKTSPPTEGSTSEMEVETSPQTEGSTSEMEIQTSPPIEGSTSEMEMQTSPPTEGSTSEMEIQTSPPTDGSTSEIEIKTSSPTEGSTSEIEIKTSPPTEGSTSEMEVETSPPTEGSTSEMEIKTSPPTDGSTSEIEIKTSPPTEGSTSEIEIKTSPPTEGSTSEMEVETSPPTEGTEISTSELEFDTSPTTEGPPPDSRSTQFVSSPPTETSASDSGFKVVTSQATESNSTPDCVGLACFESSTTESIIEPSSTSSSDPFIEQQCDEPEHSVLNNCSSSCIKTCNDSCQSEAHIAHDDTFVSINFADKCIVRCECKDGYVLHEGVCILQRECPDERTMCQKQLHDVTSLFKDNGIVPELVFCDDEGNHLAKQCVGLNKCTCVDRDGISTFEDEFYFSYHQFYCDFDYGLQCSEGKVFEECESHDRLCGLLEHPPTDKCKPGCRCPDETPYTQGGECVAEADCIPMRPHEDVIESFFLEHNLNTTDMAINPETCTNGNPTCAQWASRNLCNNGYLIKNCKKACGLCEAEQMAMGCQGMRNTLNKHLDENMIFGAPSIVCLEEDPASYFPRQCIGSVCSCVNEQGISDPTLHHSLSHPFQCPGTPKCPTGQLYLDCAIKETCESDGEAECFQGCGCYHGFPVYATDGDDEPYCASVREACPNKYTIYVFEDMECHAAAEIAIAQMKPAPQCDQLDNKYYLPNQCGLDVCYCVTKEGAIEEENVAFDYICPRAQEQCYGGKLFTDCGTACPLTCENVLTPPKVCTLNCFIGCQCTSGVIENSAGECVSAFACDGFEANLPKSCDDRKNLFKMLQMDEFEPQCTAEGDFEYRQCLNSTCHCANPKTGVKLEGTEHEGRNIESMDCEMNYLASVADCKGGMVFTMCGESCEQTCEDPNPDCGDSCEQKCQCPDDAPIYDQESQACIKISMCPVITTPTPQQTTTADLTDYYSCSVEEGFCDCLDGSRNIIPNSKRDDAFFDRIGMSPRNYCHRRWMLAQEGVCARMAKAEGGESLTCTADGKYAPVQCDGDKCYCVDSYGSRNISEMEHGFEQGDFSAFSTCVNAINMRLEEHRCLQEMIVFEQGVHDLLLGVFQPDCLSNGDYGPTQCRGAQCYCVSLEGETIPDTHFNRGENQEEFCETNRKTIMARQCYQDRENALQTKQDFEPHCTILGYYHPTQCLDSDTCMCVDIETGDQLEGTNHSPFDAGLCGSSSDPYIKCSDKVERSGMEFLVCTDTGMYFSQQCMETTSCECVDKWGEAIEDSDHHVAEHKCFLEERKELSDTMSGSPCEMERAIANTIHGGSGYIPECTEDSTFYPHQCFESTCFCVNDDGSPILGSDHQASEKKECREVIMHIRGPNPDYSKIGEGSSITCSIAASYEDEDFVMYIDGVAFDELSDDSVWKEAVFEWKSYDLKNGTIESSIQVLVEEFNNDHNMTEIRCYSMKHEAEVTTEVVLHRREQCSDKAGQFGMEFLVCTDTGMYFSQQCMGTTSCECVDEWGKVIEESDHHVAEHRCFLEEKKELSETISGSPCEMEREITNTIHGGSGYIPECTEDSTFYPHQCFESTCFCVNDDGSPILGSDHQASEEKECREVIMHIRGPKPDYSKIGEGSSITCSIAASYEDEDFVMYIDGVAFDELSDDSVWKEAAFEWTSYDLMNGTIESSIEGFVEEFNNDHNMTEIRCYSMKHEAEVTTEIVLHPREPTKCMDNTCMCVDITTGYELEGTNHSLSDAGLCGSSSDPYIKCSDKVEQPGMEFLVCTDTGMYFSQQCMGTTSCECVDKWGEAIEDSDHHVAEHTCFLEEKKELSETISGSPCEMEREIANTIHGGSGYIPECTEDSTFYPHQCFESTCFCVNDDGSPISESDHQASEEKECREVIMHIRGPKPDYSKIGEGSSITCSIAASYEDEDFVMYIDGVAFDELSDDSVWKEAGFEWTSYDLMNGTIESSIEGFVEEFNNDHNMTEIRCYSMKHEAEVTTEIVLHPREPSKCMENTCMCVDITTGYELEGTNHSLSDAGLCGSSSDPYIKCSDKVEQPGMEFLVCTDTGMYFAQQCMETTSCECVNKWGEAIEDSDHHVAEHKCFLEERKELSDTMSGSPCEMERAIANTIHGGSGYIPKCTEDSTFYPHQCFESTCFCVNDDGSPISESDHQASEEKECREVIMHIRGPKPDYSKIGEGSSITCSIAASYEDEDFVMYIDGVAFDELSDDSVWKEAGFEWKSYDLKNGTIESSVEGFVDEFTKEHNMSNITCYSLKNAEAFSFLISLDSLEVTIAPTDAQEPTTVAIPVYIKIYNPKRGYVYSEDPDNVVAVADIADNDQKALYEYMDDKTIRSVAYPDLYLTQTLVQGQISIQLKPYKGNAVQTWLRNMDSAGDSRLFVSRPSKGKRTPFYLDYFKKSLTGYKGTEKPNQKWALVLESGEMYPN